MSVLVVDVGTSGVRALVVRPDGSIEHEHHRELLPSSPRPGTVEFDAAAMVSVAEELWSRVRRASGAVDAVAVASQRASTVAWDARDGRPVGPGIGWQDLRTVGRCLELRGRGIPVAPNHTATKAEWLSARAEIPSAHLRIGTVDSWIAWHLTRGEVHVTDATNACVTGLVDATGAAWDEDLLGELGIPPTALPTIVDTAGVVGRATAVEGAPPLAALVGDQQASLVGQGCVQPGQAKITFGTGAMLDLVLAEPAPPPLPGGTFPIVAWRARGAVTPGIEAVMLSAGTAVEWLRDGLGLVSSAAETADVAASVDDAGGVVFVPSLTGTGTPDWDHGARGLLVGLGLDTTAAHVVRAVLEGVALRGADLVDAVERATGTTVEVVRVDGGMSRNGVFVQSLADATRRSVEVSAEQEATALGAGMLAGVAVDIWTDLVEASGRRRPPTVVEPTGSLDRARAAEARRRAGGWIPALSDLDL